MDDKSTYKRNLAIIISVAVVLVIAGVTAILVLLLNNNKKTKYYETIKRAESYMTSMKYEEAIAEYEKALKLNDSDPKTYENLAVLYETTGNTAKAKTVAINGYKKTNDKTLSEMVTNLNVYGNTGYTISENLRAVVSNKDNLEANAGSNKKVTLKNLIVTWVTVYKYQDYMSMYGDGTYSLEGDYSLVSYDDMTLYYPSSMGSLEAIKNSNSIPVAVSYKNISSIFDGIDTNSGVDFETAKEALGGVVDIFLDDTKGINYLHATYQGMDINIECDRDGNVTSQTPWNMFYCVNRVDDTPTTEVAEETETEDENHAMQGSVEGKIIDAVTGRGTKGAHIKVRKGSNMHVGAAIYETDSDNDGKYMLSLNEGNYCVQVSKNGYVDHFENISINRNVHRTGIDIIISTQLNGEIRIVLKWEASPTDLDSYLTGGTDSGSSVDVNFTHMRSYDGSNNCIAELDVDDTDGNGPETVTIHDTEGRYNFSVKDFTESGTMAGTNVTVTVYLPDNTTKTVTINHNLGSTNVWNVCTIDHGEVAITNN